MASAIPLPGGGSLQIVDNTDSAVLVEGYGMRFDSVGFDGARFDPQTSLRMPGQPADSGMFAVPNPGVYWDHGFDEIVQLTRLGEVQGDATRVDERGVWLRAMLDRSAEYTDWVLELAEGGTADVQSAIPLGWSGGSTFHLNRYIGNTRDIWPVVEFSITPTPANSGTLGVSFATQGAGKGAAGMYQRWYNRVNEAAVRDASQDASPAAAEIERALAIERERLAISMAMNGYRGER